MLICILVRINESNRRIASINRIDELNQRIAFQNDPKRPVDSLMGRQDRSKRAQDPLKTAQKPPKTLQRGPKSPQERPKTPPGALLGRSWSHLGTNRPQDRKQGPGRQSVETFWVDFGAQNGAQNDPKTIPKRVKNQDEKCITFLSLLELSWSDLGSILDLVWTSKSLIFHLFYNEFVEIDFFEKRALQDAFWPQLGSI